MVILTFDMRIGDNLVHRATDSERPLIIDEHVVGIALGQTSIFIST